MLSQVSCLEVDSAHGLKAHHLLSTVRAAGTLPSLERFRDAQNVARSHTLVCGSMKADRVNEPQRNRAAGTEDFGAGISHTA